MSAPPVSVVLLGLAWFAAINIVASCAVRGAAPYVLRTQAGRRGSLVLALRLLPAALSTVFVGALFVPAHWRFEPADAQESFGVVLSGLAVVGAWLIGRSLQRVAIVARAGWRLRDCRAFSEVDRRAGIYEVPGLMAVSLAGVFRTKILVGAAVRRILSADELEVALAHERAHRGAFDNLKRFLMFCAPDVLGVSAASRELEARWRATAEWHADLEAVNGDGLRAVRLASALVKVSRLAARQGTFVTSPAWSGLHEAAQLEMRVRRLVRGDTQAVAPSRHGVGPMLAALAGISVLGVSAIAAPVVQQMTEALVRLLP